MNPEDRMAENPADYCAYRKAGQVCTKHKNHQGDHVAHGVGGQETSRWPKGKGDNTPPVCKYDLADICEQTFKAGKVVFASENYCEMYDIQAMTVKPLAPILARIILGADPHAMAQLLIACFEAGKAAAKEEQESTPEIAELERLFKMGEPS